MKKYYALEEYKESNKRRSIKQHRRNLISKEKKRRKLASQTGKSKEQIKDEYIRSIYEVISPPVNFSFINYPEETIQFINKLENEYKNKNKVFVDLENLEELDYSAITILVSVMFTFQSRGILFNGNYPKNVALKRLLIDSDFFKYLFKPSRRDLEYNIGKQNQIFTRANKEVNSELGVIVMQEASQTIWGEKRICKGLQRVLLELMHNTNNHARLGEKGAKHWWLSVNHNQKEQKVSFVFIDYGIGIFESLKNKPTKSQWFGVVEKVYERFKHNSDPEMFKLLLEGKVHMTVTGHHFRGKGIPGIKEVQDRNQIDQLHFISNDVSANASANRYIKLANNFSGTFVSWEINKDNISSEWTI